MRKILVIGCAVLLLVGCSKGVSEETYESMSAEAKEMQHKIQSLEAELEDSEEKYKDVSEAYDSYRKEQESQSPTESQEATEISTEAPSETGEMPSNYVSQLEFNGESVIDSTVSFMKERDDIYDAYIEVDEKENLISIVVQVAPSLTEDKAKEAGEDTARYFASVCSWANSHFSAPSSTDIGGIYSSYDLMLYVDDGYKNFDIYGAKVKRARNITWN